MFCERCGSRLPEDARFCVSCGAAVKLHTAAATPAPQVVAVPAAPPAARCSWCGSPLAAGVLSCPGCGGKVSEMGVSTHSGWLQLPGRKDMAKLQFGQSTCQIEGIYVPVADMHLAAGDSVYFAHHVLLWKDPATVIATMPLKVLDMLFNHPLTDKGLAQFVADWAKTGQKILPNGVQPIKARG